MQDSATGNRGSIHPALLVPTVGLIAGIGTLLAMSDVGLWVSEPEVLGSTLVVLVLLGAPHGVMLAILWRSAPRQWMRRATIVISTLATTGQLLVSALIAVTDDPQTPILLWLYAPVQFLAVGVLMLLSLVIGLVIQRKQASREEDRDQPEQ